jgi:uncharacterized membrane protein
MLSIFWRCSLLLLLLCLVLLSSLLLLFPPNPFFCHRNQQSDP